MGPGEQQGGHGSGRHRMRVLWVGKGGEGGRVTEFREVGGQRWCPCWPWEPLTFPMAVGGVQPPCFPKVCRASNGVDRPAREPRDSRNAQDMHVTQGLLRG